VGVFNHTYENNIEFSYIDKGVNEASIDGFLGYTEFPDVTRKYTNNVLDIISQRIIPFERRGANNLFKFWNVPQEQYRDRWSIIAYTQGWLPTDNFEFLADFQPTNGLEIVTDLAGLTYNTLPADKIQIGDSLEWIHEKNNSHDDKAVLVTKDGDQIGYVKKIHANLFLASDLPGITTKVHAIEKNGSIKRVFVKIIVNKPEQDFLHSECSFKLEEPYSNTCLKLT